MFGALRTSERIPRSIVARQPLIVRRGVDDNVRAFHHMAELVDERRLRRVTATARWTATTATSSIVAAGPLPEDLARCARPARPPARWTGRRRWNLGTTVTSVRVRDVSDIGRRCRDVAAAARGRQGRAPGWTGWPGQPALAVAVKNVMPAARRVGLGFATKGDTSARLVAAARDALAAAATARARLIDGNLLG